MALTRLAVAFDEPPTMAHVACLRLLGIFGPDPRWRWHAPNLLTVTLSQPLAQQQQQDLAHLPGVRRVVDWDRFVDKAAPRAIWSCIGLHREPLAMLAGPCSVESAAQIDEIAAAVAEHGATGLRGGAFKPRTSAWAFGGLGEPGLQWLAAASAKHRLPLITEALDKEQLLEVAQVAAVIQIGARNMQNFPLLFAAGRNAQARPVLLKRGPSATLHELRSAAEYVRLGQFSVGHEDAGVLLCERGVRGFDPETRHVFDLGAIGILRQTGKDPVIADPSHALGRADLVRPLACAAVAAGAHGLLLEVHTQPAAAWCDGPQSIDPDEFGRLAREAKAVHAALSGLRNGSAATCLERARA